MSIRINLHNIRHFISLQSSRFKLVFLLFTGVILVHPSVSVAQKKEKYDSAFIRKHSPSKAAAMSALLPGLGQAYNKRYWKVPVIYAGFGVLTYFIITNDREYLKFRDAYTAKNNRDSTSSSFSLAQRYDSQTLLNAREYYRRNLEVSCLIAGVLYILNILDASIDAHLLTYDISDDLDPADISCSQPGSGFTQWGFPGSQIINTVLTNNTCAIFMKIALFGYGKMGKEIEKIALKHDHKIVVIYDNENDWRNNPEALNTADVAIEFTMPSAVVSNIRRCFQSNVPVVVGTTGWIKDFSDIRSRCLSGNQALFFAPNFSIGVNIFFEINKSLARLMSKYHDYEISIEETHHIQKQDAPSGTAIKLANDLIGNIGRKEKWVKDASRNPEEFAVRSVRTEDVTGTHVITYESPVDIIEIKHTAKNRIGFATGAIMAAEWLVGKKGVFEMKDML